jgi:23S rRNA (uridine2552-2'-O)-methyltransferase
MAKPYVVRDKFYQKAQEQGLRARSAFKLDEIQQKFKAIKPGHVVADLGAAPGSWSQRLTKLVGPKGHVIAFDLQEIDPIADNVEIHQADITDEVLLSKIIKRPVHGVVADLAPKTTGRHDADAYHSAELNHSVLNFCDSHLKKGGYVITKIFQGEEFQEVVARSKKMFSRVKVFKPVSCRDRSRETYIIGIGFK